MKLNKVLPVLVVSVVAMFMVEPAFAQDVPVEASAWAGEAWAAAFAVAIPAMAGAIAQAWAATTALKGIARNPAAASKMNTPLILGLGLIETLVIYGLIIAFFLQNKIVM